jgi:hypothetical protein
MYWLVLNVICEFAEATDMSADLRKVHDSRYCVVLVNWDWEGIWGMRVALGGYSPGEGKWLGDFYLCQNIYPLHYSACASSKRSSGRSIWDWYSLTPSVTKQVPASYAGPHFLLFLSLLRHLASLFTRARRYTCILLILFFALVKIWRTYEYDVSTDVSIPVFWWLPAIMLNDLSHSSPSITVVMTRIDSGDVHK